MLVNPGSGVGSLILVSSIRRTFHCKVLSSSHATSSGEGIAAACRNGGVGSRVLSALSICIMDEKVRKWSQDEGEFDAVMFRSRNGTQGEAGVGLKPLSVLKFRMLLFS